MSRILGQFPLHRLFPPVECMVQHYRYATMGSRERPLSLPLPLIRGTLPRHGKGVALGQFAEVERIFTRNDVELFGHLVGDRNPLHSCMTFEEASKFKTWQHAGLLPLATEGPTGTTEALVHGMLVASLFSCIFGSLIPGAIYRSQGLHFRSPIFANDAVLGRIHVTKVKVAHQGLIVTCDTTVIRQERTCVTGEATVWLPEGTITNEDVV